MDVLSIFKKQIEDLTKLLDEEVRQIANNQLLEYTSEIYNRSLFVKTILFRSHPKKLMDFYQPLSLMEFSSKGRILKGIRQTINIEKLIENRSRICIIGKAGSGKSTLLKYFIVKCVDDNLKIPIKIELRYLNNYSNDLSDYIYEKIFKQNKLAISQRILERLLLSGKFILFIDGFDEIQSDLIHKRSKEIDDFISNYPNNHYIITSRPHAGVEFLPQFFNYEVCELSNLEIDPFIRKQIPESESEIAEKIISEIKQEKNKSYRSFLNNPLLLSMFILTFQSYSKIPQKVSFFYQYVFDTLFSFHDSVSKMGFVREKVSGLSKSQFEEILKLLSFITFFEGKIIFTPSYIDSVCKKIKKNKPSLNFINEQLLNDLTVAIGILAKEGLDYTFPHRSLQEYFAALYISRLNAINKKSIYSKLRNNQDDKIINSNFLKILSEIDDIEFIKEYLLGFVNQTIKIFEPKKHRGLGYFDIEYWFRRLLNFELLENDEIKRYYRFEKTLYDNLSSLKKEIEINKFCDSFYNTAKRIKKDLFDKINEFEKGDMNIIELVE